MTTRLKSTFPVLMLAAALVTSGGCDDPTDRIVTALFGPRHKAKVAAAGSRRTVTLTATGTKPLQGFTLRVEYPLGKGGFAGSADGVECTSAAPGFTPNDKDDGTMILVSGTAGRLTFPIEVHCHYDEIPGQMLAASDIAVVVQSVTAGGDPGSPDDLSATVSIE